jgi:predicted RNA-binding Zn-ribbon protein involved in translation (DUF1610 family)
MSMNTRFEDGYTGDGFTHQEDEDFAVEQECIRAASRISETLGKGECPNCGQANAFRLHFTPFIGYSCVAMDTR